MSDDKLEFGASNPILGSLKIAGAHAGAIVGILTLVVVGAMAWTLHGHAADAREGGKEVAKELKEANREVAQALKESNKEVSRALQDFAAALRERNCLDQFHTPQEKARNADLCKRVSR